MNLKKLVSISDHFTNCASPRKKVVSGFSLGVVLFFIVSCFVFFNVSFKNPISNNPVFQGFNVNNNGSVIPWYFAFSRTPSVDASSSSPIVVKSATQVQKSPKNLVSESIGESNDSSVDPSSKLLASNGEVDLGDTHLRNFTNDVKNGSFNGVSEKVIDLEGAHLRNFTDDVKNGSFNGVSGEVVDLGGTHLRNFTNDVKNESFDGVSGKVVDLGDTHLRNFTKDVKNGSFNGVFEKPIEGKVAIGGDNSSGSVVSVGLDPNFDLKNNVKNDTISQTLNLRNYSNSYEECDIFNGRWVRDDTKPYYPAGSCPYVDRDFDCHLNKRPDDGFVKWKWQPFGCEIPSLNATDFLERLRGKKLVFVGDSLNRNMWESLVCILRQSLRYKKRVYEISGRREFKKKGFYAFRFEDYNCTVDFVSSPFLVRESSFIGKNGSFETLRLDLMDRTASMYHDADVLVFNTGHWWTHEKTSRGEDYYQEGNHVYPRLKVLDAYTRALSTWARWVDKNIDSTRTQVIFRGYSVTHFRGGQWNSGGQCHKETEPIFNTTHLTKYPSKMRALDHVLRDMKTPVIYLNISRLTDYRKDGHPSIYRMAYKSVEEQIAAEHSQDCSHWCLPGVPDTWNELLYASLLKFGRGFRRR